MREKSGQFEGKIRLAHFVDERVFVLFGELVLVLVQVLSYVLVEVLVRLCQVNINKPWAKWAVWTCGKRLIRWQAWEEHELAAWVQAAKEVLSVFQQEIYGWLCVLRCRAEPTKISMKHRPHHRSSPMQQMELNQCGNSGRFAWTLLAAVVQSRLPNTKQTAKRLQVVHWHLIQMLCHCALKKYGKIHRVGEYNPWTFSWRVQSDSDGVARSTPLSRKKKVCKH